MLVPIDQIPTIFRLLGIGGAGAGAAVFFGTLAEMAFGRPTRTMGQVVLTLVILVVICVLPNVWAFFFARKVWLAKKKWSKAGLNRNTWLVMLAIVYGLGLAGIVAAMM